jgi:hypothetical protein
MPWMMAFVDSITSVIMDIRFCQLLVVRCPLIFGLGSLVLGSWFLNFGLWTLVFVLCSLFFVLEFEIWNLKFAFLLLPLPPAVCLLFDRRHLRSGRLPSSIAPHKLVGKVKGNVLIFHQ